MKLQAVCSGGCYWVVVEVKSISGFGIGANFPHHYLTRPVNQSTVDYILKQAYKAEYLSIYPEGYVCHEKGLSAGYGTPLYTNGEHKVRFLVLDGKVIWIANTSLGEVTIGETLHFIEKYYDTLELLLAD